jgi:hypothetical protein
MIRKSGNRFSLATNAERVCAEIMLKQRDEIMMRFHQSHHDLAAHFDGAWLGFSGYNSTLQSISTARRNRTEETAP